MRFGYLSLNTACGIRPDELARELEARGFESVWFPEHSHLPVGSLDQFPDPRRAIPDGYAHMMNPFVSAALAAGATRRLRVGTGMALGLEHQLLDLACTAATLDVLSEGRFVLGLGAGWNAEELANHDPRIPFRRRYSALAERVAALRAAWSDGEDPAYRGPFAATSWGRKISRFEGVFDRFSPSWVFPKPASGRVPIALGLAGPTGTEIAVRLADLWAPVDTALTAQGATVAERLAEFRDRLAEAGRDPAAVPVVLFNIQGVDEAVLETYATLPIAGFVFGPPTFERHGRDATLAHLDRIQPWVERYATAPSP